MRTRKLFSLLLAGTMMMGVLTGCWGGKKDDPSSGSGSGDSDITWTDPDYDKNKVDSSAEYTIAVDVGSNGTVSPGSPLKVKGGGSVSFTVTANAGRSITGIQIDNVDQPMKGSVEKLKVTLEKVSKNHTVTVKFTEKTYTVTASANSGGSIQYNNTVKYNGTASITATPEDFYKVASVTATMGGTSVTVENDGKQTYTVSKVTGNVVFTVTFEKAAIESVTLSGTPSTTTYKVGDTFEVDGLNAIIKYTNGQEKTEPLDSQNVTVTPATLAADTKEVKIEYTRPDGVKETLTYTLSGNVTISGMSQEDIEEIKGYFAGLNSFNSSGVNVSVGTNKKLQEALKGVPPYKFYLVMDNQQYTFSKKIIELKGDKENIKTQIQSFFTEDVTVANAAKAGNNVEVYMDINMNTCTLWAVQVPKQ